MGGLIYNLIKLLDYIINIFNYSCCWKIYFLHYFKNDHFRNLYFNIEVFWL